MELSSFYVYHSLKIVSEENIWLSFLILLFIQ